MLSVLKRCRELSGLDEIESLMISMNLCSKERSRVFKNIRRVKNIMESSLSSKGSYASFSIEALEKQVVASEVFDDYFGTRFLKHGKASIDDFLSRKLSRLYGMDEFLFLYLVAAAVKNVEMRSIIIESGVFRGVPGIIEKLLSSERRAGGKTRKKALFNSAMYLLGKAAYDPEVRDLLFMLVSSLNIDPPHDVPSREQCALMTKSHNEDRRIRRNTIHIRKLVKKGWNDLLDEHGAFFETIFSAPEVDNNYKALQSLIRVTVLDFINGFGFGLRAWPPVLMPPRG